jgi:hypothetical protein
MGVTSLDVNRVLNPCSPLEAQLQSTLNIVPAYAWYALPGGALTFVNEHHRDHHLKLLFHRAGILAELAFENRRFHRSRTDHTRGDTLARKLGCQRPHKRTQCGLGAIVGCIAGYSFFCQAPEPVAMMDPPSLTSGSAFCTVKKTPCALVPNVLSTCSGVTACIGTGSAHPHSRAKYRSRPCSSQRS